MFPGLDLYYCMQTYHTHPLATAGRWGTVEELDHDLSDLYKQ